MSKQVSGNGKLPEIKKEVFIKEIKAFVGKEIRQPFLLRTVRRNKQQGQLSQCCELADASGIMKVYAWAENMNSNYGQLVGKVVLVTGMVEQNQDEVTMSISDMSICENYNVEDYIYVKDVQKMEKLKENLMAYVEKIESSVYKELVSKVLNQTIVKKMGQIPADTDYADYNGGLLVHTLEVVRNVESQLSADVYFRDVKPYVYTVDKDLVLAGALLHDIGKYHAYNIMAGEQKTVRGTKVPAAVDSIIIIEAYRSILSREVQMSDMTDLRHVILAAGEEVEPMTLEAIIVRNAKRAVKEMDAYKSAFAKLDREKPGNLQDNVKCEMLGYKILRVVPELSNEQSAEDSNK